MLYSVVYKKYGKIEVGKIDAGSRTQALSWAAAKFGVTRKNVTSAVAVGTAAKPAPRGGPWR